MKTPGLLLLFLLGLAPAAVRAEESALPQDVAEFLAQREECDHWRGEPPWDQARAAQIDWYSCQACSGTDGKLARLKRKYARNAQVMSELKPLTPKIESTQTLRPAFCRSLKPPPGS
jgi:hypothetical protein